MLRPLPSKPRRILIIRMGAIGDVVRVLPMLNGLRHRFPDAEIDWIVQRKAAAVLEGHPQIDRLFIVSFKRWRDAFSPAAWRLARQLRARRYDLVLEFQGMLKGYMWAAVTGFPSVRVGWGPGHAQNLGWLAYHGVRYPPGKRVNRHLRHRSLVDWLGVPDLPGVGPSIDVDEALNVDAFLATLEGRPRPWIMAYPGSSHSGSHKRWQPQRLVRALNDLIERARGTLVIGWGPAEEEEAGRIADATGGVLVPATSIRELTAILEACDLFVGMDTGPMHLSALVGTPVVAVFGRSDPVIHGPAEYLPGAAVASPDAREWSRRKRKGLAPFRDPAPEAVVEAALALLA